MQSQSSSSSMMMHGNMINKNGVTAAIHMKYKPSKAMMPILRA